MSASLSMKVNLPLLYIFFSMEWTEAHDVRLCREVLHDEPYQRKKVAMRGGKLGLKLPSGYQEVMNWCSELTSVVSEREWKGSRQIIKQR